MKEYKIAKGKVFCFKGSVYTDKSVFTEESFGDKVLFSKLKEASIIVEIKLPAKGNDKNVPPAKGNDNDAPPAEGNNK
ncbi:MAG: hypothetical protein ACRC4W_02475 [Treponemataceae bacterium]